MSGAGDSGAKFTWSEAIFLTLVVLVVWVGVETSQDGLGSPWFAQTLFGVPLHYLLFAGLVLLVLPYVATASRFPLTERLKESGIWIWLVLGWASVSLALALALIRGAPELFADWRNLAVTAVVAAVASKWLAAQSWRRYALVDLTITLGILCVPILVAYALGFGATVGGVRTTVFDATTLYIAAFATIAGMWNLLVGNKWLGKIRISLLAVATPASGLVVLLSLRRSYWVILGVGTVILIGAYLFSRQVRGIRLYAFFVAGLVVVLGAFFTLGADTVANRLESFSPSSEGAFSSTNQDHINDLIDAWQIIEDEPILGLGIGVRYDTNLISEWKQESFDVHNAVLHVWLKFGMIGALAYVGFHLAWIRRALKRPLSGAVPIGAYIAGIMVATVFATWPYGRFQVAVFIGLLLALLLVEIHPSQASATPGEVVEAQPRSF